MTHGSVDPGFAPVHAAFERLFREGHEIGASIAVYHRGQRVVDLWGGVADVASARPWARDTRSVVFSCSKGLTAMAFAMLGDRGGFDWDAPVADAWPEFAQAGKGGVTIRTLFNHRAGLPVLDTPFTLDEAVSGGDRLRDALAAQRPVWAPGDDQGYHATTYGLYAGELFTRLAGESIGTFLARELLGPLDADVSLGTPPDVDARVASLYAPTAWDRVRGMLTNVASGNYTEARVLGAMVFGGGLPRRAFTNPSVASPVEYGVPRVWRAELPWGSGTATADGLARAYLPFAHGGEAAGRRYLREAALTPLYGRQGWAERDRVLQKPLGWSQGFLKEEARMFSPVPESFGHSGLGGSIGWCDPVNQLTFAYVPNRLGPQVRSPRALALCHAIYASPALLPG